MRAIRYFSLWLRISLLYAWKDAFGWAGAAMTIIATLNHVKMVPAGLISLITNENHTVEAFSAVATAFVLAFLFNCLLSAPYRVWTQFHALYVAIPTSSTAPTIQVGPSRFKSAVRLLVQNRSQNALTCKIRVLQILGEKNRQLPWEIATITISPNNKQLVEVASCFSSNSQDHYIRIDTEKSGKFAEASVMFFRQSTLKVLLEVLTDVETKEIWCEIKRSSNKILSMQVITAVAP